MKAIFQEDFQTRTGQCPAGWYEERTSDLAFSTMRLGDHCLELLSAGNKFLPVIPELTDGTVSMTFHCNYAMARSFEVMLSFRYDMVTRRGETVRLRKAESEPYFHLQYGTMGDNRFTVLESRSFCVPEDSYAHPMMLTLSLTGSALQVSCLDCQATFQTQTPHSGRVALSRGHFFDTLKILNLEILTDVTPEPVCRRQLKVRLPLEPTFYPIDVDVDLQDFGDCYQADLTLSGGVRETVPGEGNYHVMRLDALTRPYFKVLTSAGQTKTTLYDGQIVQVPQGQAPEYFYGALYDQVEWPFRRTVRFMKPQGEFCLAVGADEYLHSTAKTLAQRPSETLFTPEGEVLYQGLGFSELTAMVEFLSQADKQVIKRLPTSDPRYEQACEFARNNHYFMEGEAIDFRVRVRSQEEMPTAFEIRLENAFLEPMRNLSFETTVERRHFSCLAFDQVELHCERLTGLEPGVYHLRIVSLDDSVHALNDYCAFEVMSGEAGALPAPLQSGLPFLYCSRTETRGLETDAFDPWHGHSVDEGHYISCANHLPVCARSYQIAPTVHAYQRQWFLWLSDRCSDHSLIADNLDLLAQADYANLTDANSSEDVGIFSLLWLRQYSGSSYQHVLEFIRQTGDSRFDLEQLEAVGKAGKYLPPEAFKILAEDYWPQWVDFANRFTHERHADLLAKGRVANPGLMLANYGPAHIYVGHYKGPEYVRYLLNDCMPIDEQGFWQYEDYPVACRYAIERGTYFLTSALMECPEQRIYPEVYTGGFGGCPDGAVFYAHPPYGRKQQYPPLNFRRRIFEYVFATAYYRSGEGFRYWDKMGFQACGFDRERYEILLNAWRTVRKFPAKRPLRSTAFVFSEEAWQANKSTTVLRPYLEYGIVDVRKTATEDVPYAYEMMRRKALNAGFQVKLADLPELGEDQCDLLVLPPLTGADQRELDAIRRLHAAGVNLLCFEDAGPLADLFGVRDTGSMKPVTWLHGTENFLPGQEEFCEEPLCAGRYEADGAEVLIEAEIPVLMQKRNEAATAVFFNVPPTLVKDDQLHDRLGYGCESISDLINEATGLIGQRLSSQEVTCSDGRLIACQTPEQELLVIVGNPDGQQEIHPVVTVRREGMTRANIWCDRPWQWLKRDDDQGVIRLRLAAEDAAVLVLS